MNIAEKVLRQKKDFDDVYDAGKQAEYNNFWDVYQQNGGRTDYSYAFSYNWNDDIFKPKYPHDKENSVLVITNAFGMFAYTKITTIPFVMDMTSVTSTNSVFFRSPALKSIKRIIFSENSKVESNMFNLIYSLEDVEFGGTIPGVNWDFAASSRLTRESVLSMFDAFKDYSKTSNSYTVKLHADAKARLTAEEIAIATEKGWTIA